MKKKKPKLTIIVQTAYVSEQDIEQVYQSGCTHHIAKPINAKDLEALLHQYLD
ncbi:MAG: hypothetical protein IPO21_03340 [Bacteroidales bacterium]|nr:hypothetical protein [Bacteroidales bacterium]